MAEAIAIMWSPFRSWIREQKRVQLIHQAAQLRSDAQGEENEGRKLYERAADLRYQAKKLENEAIALSQP